MGVAGVGVASQCVENKDVEVLEQRQALIGDVAHVGEIRGRAEAVAGDGVAAVGDRDALEASAEESYFHPCFGRQAMKRYAGAGGIAVDLAEGVLEDAFDDVGGGVVGVQRE